MASDEKKVSMRRCQTCGYDLTSLGEWAACPECGPAGEPEDRPLVEMLRIAMPSVVTMTSYTVMQFIDAKMVTHIDPPSPIYIAAQGNGGVAAWLPISFMFGILTVVNTYVSQNLGAGKPERGPAYGWTALWLSGAWAFILIPYGLLIPFIFRQLGHADDIVQIESAYGQILVFGAFLTMATRGLSNYFYGMHRARVVMVAAITGNIVNALANIVLIFGTSGLPHTGFAPLDTIAHGARFIAQTLGIGPMGVTGAAVGTIIGTAVELAIPLSVFLGHRMNERFGTRSAARPDRAAIRDVLKLGWPGGFMMFNEIICWALLLVFLVPMAGKVGAAQRLGVPLDAPDAVAAGKLANTAGWIALRYMHISFMPAIGISIAVTAVVGRCMGMGRPDLAAKRAWLGLRLTLGYMGLCALVFVVFREPLVRFFAASDLDPAQIDELVRVGSLVMIAAAIFQIFDATAITFSGALRGAGDTIWPGVVTVALSWAFIVGGGLLMIELAPRLGSIGPWIGASVYIVLLGLVMLGRFMRGPWRRIELVKPDKAGDAPETASQGPPASPDDA